MLILKWVLIHITYELPYIEFSVLTNHGVMLSTKRLEV